MNDLLVENPEWGCLAGRPLAPDARTGAPPFLKFAVVAKRAGAASSKSAIWQGNAAAN